MINGKNAPAEEIDRVIGGTWIKISQRQRKWIRERRNRR